MTFVFSLLTLQTLLGLLDTLWNHEIVERLGGHARLHQRDERIEVFRGQPPGPAHAFEGLRPVQLDGAVAQENLAVGHCLVLSHAAHVASAARFCECRAAGPGFACCG